jgi:hypothetical protein
LMIRPTAVVFAGEGKARRVVQPWVHAKVVASTFSHPADASPGHVHGNLYAAATGLGVDLLLQGRHRLSQRNWPGWDRGIRELEERGYHRIAERLRLVQHEGQHSLPFLKLWRLGTEAMSA